jgi:hypothetical protein
VLLVCLTLGLQIAVVLKLHQVFLFVVVLGACSPESIKYDPGRSM